MKSVNLFSSCLCSRKVKYNIVKNAQVESLLDLEKHNYAPLKHTFMDRPEAPRGLLKRN